MSKYSSIIFLKIMYQCIRSLLTQPFVIDLFVDFMFFRELKWTFLYATTGKKLNKLILTSDFSFIIRVKFFQLRITMDKLNSVLSMVAQLVKNMPAMQETQVDPWGKIPWTRKWQHTPVLLSGEFHRQSLVG